MTVGNLIQLRAKGPQDAILYGNPQTSYFRQVFRKATNFSMDYYKVPDNQLSQLSFGSSVQIRLPMVGDLLSGIYIRIKFEDIVRRDPFYAYTAYESEEHADPYYPRFTSYVNGIGFQCIEEATITINGQTIETITGESILLYNEVSHTDSRKKSFYSMSQFYPNNFKVGIHNVKNVQTMILLPFFFTKQPGVYLPLCALSNCEVLLTIKLKPLERCLVQSYNTRNNTSSHFMNTSAQFLRHTIWVKPSETSPGDYEYNVPPLASYKYLRRSLTGEIPIVTNISSLEQGSIIPASSIVSYYEGIIQHPAQYQDVGVKGNYLPPRYGKYTEVVNAGVVSVELMMEIVYLDESEKPRYLASELNYLVELTGIGNHEVITEPNADTKYYFDMEFTQPTKYIAWVLQREDAYLDNYYDVLTYDFIPRFGSGSYLYYFNSHLLETANLLVNNNDLLHTVDAKFLSSVQLYQRFKTGTDLTLYTYSFCLDPLAPEPTGTLNFSQVARKTLVVQLTKNENLQQTYDSNSFFTDNVIIEHEPTLSGDRTQVWVQDHPNIHLRMYSVYYNVLVIRDGLAGLKYI